MEKKQIKQIDNIAESRRDKLAKIEETKDKIAE